MATENPMRIMESSRTGKWASSRGSASFVAADELGALRRGPNGHRDQSKIAPSRSGSAPPSMEGSFAAFGNLISQQYGSNDGVFSSDLEDSAHYHSNIDSRERSSPSTHSREKVHLAQRSGISGNNWRLPSDDSSGSGSLYVDRKSLATHEEEPEDDRTDSSTIMLGQHTLSFAGRHKSLVDLIQEDFPRTPSPIFSQTLSSGHMEESFNHDVQSLSLDSLSLKASKSPEPNSGATAIQNPSAGSDPLSPHKDEETSNDGYSTSAFIGDDTIVSDGSENLNKAEGGQDNHQLGFHQQNELHPQNSYAHHNVGYHVSGFEKEGTGQGATNNGMDKVSHGHHNMTSVEMQPPLHTSGVHPPLYSTAAAYMASGSSFYPNFSASGLYAPQYSGYALNSSFVPPYLTGYPPHTGFPLHFNANSGHSFSGQNVGSPTGEAISKGPVMQNPDRFYGHHGLAMHPSFPDPLSMRYFQQLMQDPYSVPVQYSHYPPPGMIGSQVDSFALRNDLTAAAYTGDQKFQLSPSGSISIPSPRDIGLPSSNYLSSPTGLGFVPQSPLGSPVMPGSPIAGTGRRYNSGFSQTSPRNAGGYAKWQGQRGVDSINDHRKHSFLEELKSSGAQRIDLTDILGRIVEFSIDQHGSRFIQQKLEICSVEEKESVFKEILPHAVKLMTDVFGNYVIQKFFEHGSYEQRKELASLLSGHMLPLSLQMYGCRVIQKALEVIELDQKTKLVFELDGQVIRCVRDQNGNHVIQKCIECLPTAKLDFIISAFEGEVATLSTHPYGCRVIQRVLEHCSDDLQCRSIVNEILGSSNDLAQDQYGNYVIQHVLERGKPFERSQIVSKLSGKIVQMSQHKYASNVVEKCLEFCDAAERDVLIEEILAQSDDLLAMMKDQFANYVVQKILDIGNNTQRETLVNHIEVHIDALKKYTYGKHIVTRFEQLSGEGDGASDP